jgi:betaine-aldehyde dehydrogenase
MERFLAAVANLKVGDPLDPTTDFGPLITAQHRERVEGFIQSGLDEGARLLTGGKRPTDPALQKGNYLLPTVFEEVTSSMRICREEIFCPVLSVQRFHDEAEAVCLANDTIYSKVTGGSSPIKRRPCIDRVFYASVVQTGRTALDRPPR